jgi:phosphatidylglycerol---prolipoprotein diacylglyceryl transferase
MMPDIWRDVFGLGFTIHSYGAMAVVALLMGTWLISREARKVKLDPDQMFNVTIVIFIGGLIGARLLYVIRNWSDFSDSGVVKWFALWEGGLVWYGGVLGAIPCALLALRLKRLSLWESLDILYIGSTFALAFARWGCLLAGCCYGAETHLPWGVTYTNPRAVVCFEIGCPTPVLHPTPIYSSLMAFAIVGILLLVQHKKRFSGQVFGIGICLYAVARFLLEFVRGDDRARGTIELGGGTSLFTSQAIGIAMFIFGLGILLLLGKRARRARKKQAA